MSVFKATFILLGSIAAGTVKGIETSEIICESYGENYGTIYRIGCNVASTGVGFAGGLLAGIAINNYYQDMVFNNQYQAIFDHNHY